MTWQDAAERLKRLRAQGEPWTSQHQLAEQIGCSPATIKKAIKNTRE
jgi:biotin operon repressor